MHEYTQQEASPAVVVYPCHETPVRFDLNDKEHMIGNVERPERANTSPEIRKEMPDRFWNRRASCSRIWLC